MIVKVIEVIEVTVYEPRTGGLDSVPVKRYFLRDGTPLEVPTPMEVPTPTPPPEAN